LSLLLFVTLEFCRNGVRNILQIVVLFFIASKLCGGGAKNIMQTFYSI
jgi:hypothetical protein